MLLIEVPKLSCRARIPVCQSSRRYLSSTFLSEKSDERIGIIVDVRDQVDFISIAIRSVVQVYNHFKLPIKVYNKVEESKIFNLVGQIEEDGVFNIPLSALYTLSGELFFQPQG
jgi:hypothetical protein